MRVTANGRADTTIVSAGGAILAQTRLARAIAAGRVAGAAILGAVLARLAEVGFAGAVAAAWRTRLTVKGAFGARFRPVAHRVAAVGGADTAVGGARVAVFANADVARRVATNRLARSAINRAVFASLGAGVAGSVGREADAAIWSAAGTGLLSVACAVATDLWTGPAVLGTKLAALPGNAFAVAAGAFTGATIQGT